MYFQKSGNKEISYKKSDVVKRNKEKKCKYCHKTFIPKSHGGTKEFCSYHCSNQYKWDNRERNPKPMPKRICQQCGKEYQKNRSYSLTQWSQNKFCSLKCSSEAQKIKDGMTKGERHRRKKGQAKMYTQEWIEKIKAKTSEAMLRPEVKARLHNPKGPQSLEVRIRHSNALAGKLPKNMMFGANSQFGCYANIQRGDYECSKGSVYFRSKWEANYALFLDYLVEKGEIKSWEYEADVFMFEEIKLGTRSYRPDFKVFNDNGSFEYHEVKGYMDSKSKTKLKRMAKYYPEVKLILIDSGYYNDLKKKMGKILNFY